jgi:DNA modification methylase
MEWCFDQLRIPKGGLVVDPYMGAGSTGIVAVRRGHPFVGIEIEPRYYETARARILDELRRPRFLMEHQG